MLFSSQIFILVFLPIVAISYYKINSQTLRIRLLIIASFIFYGYWDIRFLPLLFISISINWLIAYFYLRNNRKSLIYSGVVLNLLLIGVFKYFNFFTGIISELTNSQFNEVSIILPLGISFFTFQQISYLVDLKRSQAKQYSFDEYLLYISFFPQLIAGPIVRHNQIIYQFSISPIRPDMHENISRGLILFTLGLCKKVFLADGHSQADELRAAGEVYLHEYPEGQWRADVSTLLGMESVGREDYQEAIQLLSDVLPHTHDEALQRYTLRHRGLVYQELGEMDLALLDFQQVVALDPLDMVNVVRLGDFLFDRGDYADAETVYDQVLFSDAPVALKAWAKYRWGLSLDYEGKRNEATKLLADVRELETRAPEFEHTIRAAAVAVLDEFSLQGKPQTGRRNEGS